MAIQQLGGGRGAVLLRPGEAPAVLGIAYCLAIDEEQKIFGWAVTGDHASHVRRYEERELFPNAQEPLVIEFKDEDGISYWFGSELTPEQEETWKAWKTERPDEEFPAQDLTLVEAAQQMGYHTVPPEWWPGENRTDG